VGGPATRRLAGLLIAAKSVVQHRGRVLDECQTHAFASGTEVGADRADQLAGLGLAALPGGEHQGAVGRNAVPRRLADRRDLLHERGRYDELAGVEVEPEPGAERQRKHGQRADVPRDLDVARGQKLPALVVPEVVGGMGGGPEPADCIVREQVLATECPYRSL
jgi:hypothetical protein